MEAKEGQIFQKYFGKLSSEIKFRQVGDYVVFTLQHGVFHLCVEKTPLGSQGFFKVGYRPHAMTILFCTPNEQGIGFEECCQEVERFIGLQIDTLRDIVER